MVVLDCKLASRSFRFNPFTTQRHAAGHRADCGTALPTEQTRILAGQVQ